VDTWCKFLFDAVFLFFLLFCILFSFSVYIFFTFIFLFYFYDFVCVGHIRYLNTSLCLTIENNLCMYGVFFGFI
jgi:hypothetical protein